MLKKKLTYKIIIFDNKQNKNAALERKEFIKYLGILIDSNLSWKHHVDYVALSRVTGLIAKLRYFVPTHTLLTIYQSFLAPYLTYGLVAWGQASKSSLDKLLKLQKRALHFIYFSNRNRHAIPLFVDANILPLIFSYYESIAKLMYDEQHGISPKSIQALFEYVHGILQYNT